MKGLVVIPAYHEEHTIGEVLQEIKRELPECDIIVVNDASKDATKEIVIENEVMCLTLPYNMGYSLAVQTGLKYAKIHKYEYVVTMDADGQHLASEAKKLIEEMYNQQADIVIGSRFIEKTEYRHGFLRRIGTKILVWLIEVTCKQTIKDPTSGFQCMNQKAIHYFAQMGNYPEFPDANLIIELLLEGYKIKEVSAKMQDRKYGTSMHKGIIKPIKYMIKVLYNIVIVLLRKIFKRKK